MAKYLRIKEDGYVMNYNAHLHAGTACDPFESEDPPPEFIPDLLEYLSGKAAPEALGRRPKKKDLEPVFLKNADGSLAAT